MIWLQLNSSIELMSDKAKMPSPNQVDIIVPIILYYNITRSFLLSFKVTQKLCCDVVANDNITQLYISTSFRVS